MSADAAFHEAGDGDISVDDGAYVTGDIVTLYGVPMHFFIDTRNGGKLFQPQMGQFT